VLPERTREKTMSKRRRRRRWTLLIVLLVLVAAGVALLIGSRTPIGRAALNIVEYNVRATWSRWFGRADGDGAGGAIAGIVRDDSGQPLEGAIALVSTFKGVTYQARSDALGTFRIEGVPPGRYVPAAAKWGYESAVYGQEAGERTSVSVRAERLVPGVEFTLRQRGTWQPSLDEPPILGPPEVGYSAFPAEISATRIPITYVNEGWLITTRVLY